MNGFPILSLMLLVEEGRVALSHPVAQYLPEFATVRVGVDRVATFFADRATHTNDAGARFTAACVAAGLRSLPGNPLGTYFAPAPPTAP